MTKYRYYFRKPRSEMAKDIIQWLFVGSAIVVAATSPHFGVNAWKMFKKINRQGKYQKQKFSDTFTRLKRRKLIFLEKRG